jgi:GNAT superfamily N-acetyltransferase
VEKADLVDATDLSQFLLNEFYARHAEILGGCNVKKTVAGVIRAINQGVVLVVRDDEGVVGTLALEAAEPWYSTEKQLGDRWFFVLPNERGHGSAVALMDAAKRVAAEHNMKLFMSNVTGDKVEAKDRFFRKNGFEVLGGVYRWSQ